MASQCALVRQMCHKDRGADIYVIMLCMPLYPSDYDITSFVYAIILLTMTFPVATQFSLPGSAHQDVPAIDIIVVRKNVKFAYQEPGVKKNNNKIKQYF